MHSSVLRTGIGVGVGERLEYTLASISHSTTQHPFNICVPSSSKRDHDAHGSGRDKSTLPPLMMIPTGPLTPRLWNAGLRTAAKAVALLGSTTSFSLSQSKRIASMISYMQTFG